jgi:hypothetical protein
VEIILSQQINFMRQLIIKRNKRNFLLFFAPSFVLTLFFLICSFTAQKLADDFLKQLGITQQAADEKIANSILGGYIDSYGIRNAKNIASGNRKAITLDLLNYIKKYAGSAAFIKEYGEMRERYKPTEHIPQTPEEMRKEMIENAKNAVVKSEEMLRRSDPSFKTIFEKNVEDSKKALKDAEDPNNKHYMAYTKNYPQAVKNYKASCERAIADWNTKYPSNQLLFVKKRLEEFLNVTKDIDFSAELTERNGKKIFVNQHYEFKDSRWKMAFRAGKEVVEPARDFVEKWINEIR